MRKTETNNGLKVHAIAGTYVTLFGFHLPQSACDGLLGFSLHRFDHTENEAYFLKATKAFAETDPGLPPGSQYSTRDHPIQSFQWSDYTAKPGHDYFHFHCLHVENLSIQGRCGLHTTQLILVV